MSGSRVLGCVALCVLSLASAAATASKPTTAAKSVAVAARPSRYEQMLKMMLPQEKLDKATEMFAPIALKYKAVAERFRSEFEQSKSKRDVIIKYMPQAESALAEAKAMEVPQELYKDKADFVRTADALIKVMKFTVNGSK